MVGPFKARQAIEESQFEAEKKQIHRSVKRLDEILDGLIWTLSRKPEAFPQVVGLDLYLAKTDSTASIPPLYIWFTFNDEEVRLFSIEIAPKAG